MNAARFLIEVQRRAGSPANVRDPLAIARFFIWSCPTLPEAQVLKRLIRALLAGTGHFTRDDLNALTPEGFQLASALIAAQLLNLYTDRQWRAAALSLVPLSA